MEIRLSGRVLICHASWVQGPAPLPLLHPKTATISIVEAAWPGQTHISTSDLAPLGLSVTKDRINLSELCELGCSTVHAMCPTQDAPDIFATQCLDF